MRLNIIDSVTTIQAICSPVYGEITNTQRRHQVFFPEQRDMFVKLIYKTGAWKLYHSNRIMNKGRIKKAIVELDKSITLDMHSIYFGLLDNDKIKWVFIIQNANVRTCPDYPDYYNSMTRVLAYVSRTGNLEYELRSPDNLIMLDNNRYSIVNSPLFSDYFIWALFQLPGIVPASLYQKFSDHVKSKGYSNTLDSLINDTRQALCQEITDAHVHAKTFRHNGPLYSIFVIYSRHRNLDYERVEEIMLKANNQYRCDVIRYLKQRSSIIQGCPFFDRDNPLWILIESILRD